jgi:5'-deoxynucleotidase YfbR-like HD superfamily hydrolase
MSFPFERRSSAPSWVPEPRTDHNWIQTFSGRQFWPLNPFPDEIFIEDIAHALSLVCRYTGHCSSFYSVAQHSVRVSYRAQKLFLQIDKSPGRFERARIVALCGLLHDASEAYISDVSRPVKHSATFGPIYKEIEANLEAQINRRFGLPAYLPVIKKADNELLATERRDLMAVPPREWSKDAQPLPDHISPWTSTQAEYLFLYRFQALKSARQVATL